MDAIRIFDLPELQRTTYDPLNRFCGSSRSCDKTVHLYEASFAPGFAGVVDRRDSPRLYHRGLALCSVRLAGGLRNAGPGRCLLPRIAALANGGAFPRRPGVGRRRRPRPQAGVLFRIDGRRHLVEKGTPAQLGEHKEIEEMHAAENEQDESYLGAQFLDSRLQRCGRMRGFQCQGHIADVDEVKSRLLEDG